MELALSASWNAANHTNGKDLLFEIKELGFDKVELSFNLTAVMLEEIIHSPKQQLPEIISVHNFCPIPDNLKREAALPDCYNLASLNQGIRECALKYTKRTIDAASCLGAKAVVLHCGRVEIPDRMRSLIDLYAHGLAEDNEFKEIRSEMIKERRAHAKPFFENALKSLEELNAYAVAKKIAIGVETRFYYREIPSFEETKVILDKFKSSNIFYWHDIGHAQVMQNLGFNCHKDYLEQYSHRMIGIHLHDLKGCQDHLAPAKGEFDFSSLVPFIKAETLKVMEAHQPATGLDLVEAKKFLNRIFNGNS